MAEHETHREVVVVVSGK